MRTTLQRPAPPSAWNAERTSVRRRPSLALQRAQFAPKAAQAPRTFGEMSPRSSSLSTRARAAPSDDGPASSPSPSSSAQTRVLMVCLGNICRSPAAEAVLAHLVKKRKLGDSVFVDSCGTGGGSGDWYKEGGYSYHEGDAADSRMRSAASRRGIAVTSRSRPLRPRDFHEFDVVVAMDSANRAAIARAREHWISTGKLKEEEQRGGGERARVVMMTDYLRDEKLARLAGGAVPDPYYGGEKGFETVLDLLEDACEGLLEEIV